MSNRKIDKMNKFSIKILLFTLLIVAHSCTKDYQVCNGNVEIKDTNHLVDISVLKEVPAMLDTLTKYPELKVTSIINDQYQTGMTCNYYFKGLICFGASYSLNRSKRENYWFCQDNRPKEVISTNLDKKIEYQKALEIAKKEIDFKNSCLSYQLGFYYADTSAIETPISYKLVWNVKSIGGSAYVVLDAKSGFIYSKFDGVFQ